MRSSDWSSECALPISDIARDDDIQMALFALYASSYGSIEQFSADLEWDPALVGTRRLLEEAFEAELRATVPVPELPEPTAAALARLLLPLNTADRSPSLAPTLFNRATPASTNANEQ